MKILVVSDTHGHNENLWKAIKAEEPFDMMIHCGDIEVDQYVVRDNVDCALHMVAGNNDYDPDLDRIKAFDIGKHRAVLTHGHRYRLYEGMSQLDFLARENQADIVFFGHTHVPVIKNEGGIYFINPGSLTYPRQLGRVPTYIVMTLDANGDVDFQLKNL